MPPRSPLPRRHGLDAAWVRSPDRDPKCPAPWHTMAQFLQQRLAAAAPVEQMLTQQRFVTCDGVPITEATPYRPHTFIWFHRDLRDEAVVPGELTVLHHDERLVVIDKPHFLSTIPRGRHVLQSVVVRTRDELGLTELGPAHRLDRLTAGVLVLTTQRRWRASYQRLFELRQVNRVYEALAMLPPEVQFPINRRSHIVKQRGVLQAFEVSDRPANALTTIDLVERQGLVGRLRLVPHTGRTHQLRVHLNALGMPILNDPLYPRVLEVSVDDFSTPLQLVASELSFVDPIDHTERVFRSHRRLAWPVGGNELSPPDVM